MKLEFFIFLVLPDLENHRLDPQVHQAHAPAREAKSRKYWQGAK
jgi:hypothetical protein